MPDPGSVVVHVLEVACVLGAVVRALRLVRALRARVLLVGAGLLLAGVVPSPVEGQEPARSPHGPLPDDLVCLDCHTTEAWTPLRADRDFDHGAYGGFVLDGRHAETTCAGCHEGLVFQGMDVFPGDCVSCHVDVHQGSLSRPCGACHITESFTDMNPGVVHPADFPLEGAHLQTTCESCHVNDLGGAYAPLDRECATCHYDEYVMAPLVDHQALGFSTDCTECHSVLDFRDVAFDHVTISGGFELLGRHAAIACTACHSLPGGGIPTAPAGPEDCVACHLDDYQNEHGGSGFPTDCRECHSVDTWDDATFDHAFQIFNGPHASPWDSCADCHIVSGDFSQFTCLTCHGRTDMDDRHREEPGYAYESNTCLGCHPTGRRE